MPKVTKPYGDLQNGQTADANQVDQQFNTLYTLLNQTGLDDANMAPGGISGVSLSKEAVKPTNSEGLPYASDLFNGSFIFSGGVPTKDGTIANQLDIPIYVAYIVQSDGTNRRITTAATNKQTSFANSTYYLDLNPDGTFAWGSSHSTQSGYMTICTVNTDGSGNISNVVDTRVTQVNIMTGAVGQVAIGGTSLASIQNNISNLQYDVYNMELQNYYNSIITPKQGMQFDGFSDTNQADMTNTTLSANVAAGASSISVTSATGFKVGSYVSIVDATHYEEHLISSISGTTITFSDTLTNGFSSGAIVARTSSTIDTTNKKLNGATITAGGTATVTTPTNVVASAYDTSGNGGRKLVRLSNGWLVAGVHNTSVSQIYFYVSKDNGTTWSQLCFSSSDMTAGMAMASSGTTVYVLWGVTGQTQNHFAKFDATTVSNADIGGGVYPDSGQTSFGSGCSLAIDGTGALHAAWCSKNSTYPNSFNIRYSKSTDGGNTWATPTQLTSNNVSTNDMQQPCIVLRSNNYPTIVFQQANGSTYLIGSLFWNGAAWSSVVYLYNPGAYTQSAPCAAVDSSDNIHVVWHGEDATYTGTYQIKYSKSTDGGSTWTGMVNLTAVSTAGYHQTQPSITIDASNNLYALWQGIDASSSSAYNIYKIVNTSGTWGSATKLTTNTSNTDFPSTLWSKFNMNCNFTDPLTIYVDGQASAVKFRGTWTAQVATPVTKTAYFANRVTYPQAQSNAKMWLRRSVVVSTTLFSSSLAGATSITVASATNMAVGDTIDVREGTYWERVTISAISSNTLTITPSLQNAYDTSAIVARVDDIPNVAIVASGANEAFTGMTWQRSALMPDNTVEDTYYYQTSSPGTDVVVKINQTRASTSAPAPQATRYGLAVGI